METTRLTPRTEALAMRLDPQIKYMAELVSRQERRSLTSFVEWAIDQALREVRLNVEGVDVPAAQAMDRLWDIDGAERLRKLSERCPNLLNYEEHRLMHLVVNFMTDGAKPLRFTNGGEINWSLVKACWQQLKDYVPEGVDTKENLVASLRLAQQENKTKPPKRK